MVVSLRGMSEIDKDDVSSYFASSMCRHQCCWCETAEGLPHVGVSGWALLAKSKVEIPPAWGEVEFILNNQSEEGWWPIYPVPLEREYASTYATAVSILALREVSKQGRARTPHGAAINRSLRLGRRWLLNTRMKRAAAWWDYPFNAGRSQSEGLSGIVMHALRDTPGRRDELQKIDRLWLQNLPTLGTDAKSYVASDVRLAGGLTDSTKNYSIPWSLIATAGAFAHGTPEEKAEALAWVDRHLLKHLEEITLSVVGDRDWITTELLISFRYLLGERVI